MEPHWAELNSKQRSIKIIDSSARAPVKSFGCAKCTKTFSKEAVLKIHERVHATNKVGETVTRVTKVPNKVTTVPNKVTTVPNKVTTVPNKVTAVPNKVTTVPNKVTTVPNKVHQRVHEKNEVKVIKYQEYYQVIQQFRCNTCKKNFSDAETLKIHERVHDTSNEPRTNNGNSPLSLTDFVRFSCIYCKKGFEARADLMFHYQNLSRCEKHTSYSYKHNYLRRDKEAAEIEKKKEEKQEFQIQEIKRSAKQKDPLELMSKSGQPSSTITAVGGNIWGCSVCNFVCAKKGNLKIHEWQAHGISEPEKRTSHVTEAAKEKPGLKDGSVTQKEDGIQGSNEMNQPQTSNQHDTSVMDEVTLKMEITEEYDPQLGQNVENDRPVDQADTGVTIKPGMKDAGSVAQKKDDTERSNETNSQSGTGNDTVVMEEVTLEIEIKEENDLELDQTVEDKIPVDQVNTAVIIIKDEAETVESEHEETQLRCEVIDVGASQDQELDPNSVAQMKDDVQKSNETNSQPETSDHHDTIVMEEVEIKEDPELGQNETIEIQDEVEHIGQKRQSVETSHQMSKKHKFDGCQYYHCSSCEARINNEEEYLNHSVTSKCTHCTATFSCATLFRMHERLHVKKAILCPACHNFIQPQYWEGHKCNWKKEPAPIYACRTCKKEFNFKGDAEEHEDQCGKSPTDTVIAKNTKNTSSMRFFSCTCGLTFTRPSTLYKHRREKHNEPHMKILETPYECMQCGEKFSQVGFLKEHEKKHLKEKRYECKVCGKCFKGLNFLKKHEVNAHVTPFKCAKCGLRFPQAEDLKEHERQKHGVMWPYECTKCDKTFSSSIELKFHDIHHVDSPSDVAKKYTCSFCTKTFEYKGDAEDHETTHYQHTVQVQRGWQEISTNREKICQEPLVDKPSPRETKPWGRDQRVIVLDDGKDQPRAIQLPAVPANRPQGSLTGDPRFSCIHCKTGFEVRKDLMFHYQHLNHQCPKHPSYGTRAKYNYLRRNKEIEKQKEAMQEFQIQEIISSARHSKDPLELDPSSTSGSSGKFCKQCKCYFEHWEQHMYEVHSTN